MFLYKKNRKVPEKVPLKRADKKTYEIVVKQIIKDNKEILKALRDR